MSILPASLRLTAPPHLPTSTPNLSDFNDIGCPTRVILLVLNVLTEHDLHFPERSQLEMIARAALAAGHHFFSAALHEPTQAHLDSFTERFVMFCASADKIQTETSM